MWTNYEYLNTSFVGQYFKTDCDVIAVAMATVKVRKNNLQISLFASYLLLFQKAP